MTLSASASRLGQEASVSPVQNSHSQPEKTPSSVRAPPSPVKHHAPA